VKVILNVVLASAPTATPLADWFLGLIAVVLGAAAVFMLLKHFVKGAYPQMVMTVLAAVLVAMFVFNRDALKIVADSAWSLFKTAFGQG